VSLIRGTDPLALLAIQAGQTPTPGDQRGARGSNPLDVQQVAHKIGDPVPIAFGRQRNGAGGVFISPKATECRFENDTDNDVTAFYHLVLSEGRIGSLQVRDVFQRQCRVGSFTQTYNRRAGTWTPGNAIVVRAGFDKPEATYLCGTVGAYPGMSTLSFQVTIPNGFDVWNRQVHCFVRNGMEVYRWADDTANVSSDSFADLAYWLMVNSARIPVSLIDTDSIESTSVFLNANNITTNCWLTEAINYSELISRWGPYHLLRSSSRNGKAGLKPLLPTNSNGTIKTTALTVEYTFTDDLVIPGSEEIVYSDWASRQPFVAQVVWRQQLDADVGIIRTAEVRYAGTAGTGPYETHDLSQFCTREDHAVKVGAYILAKRVRSTHTMRFKVRPQSHNTIVQQGSIVRVRLERNASGDVPVFHDYLYEVERITRTLAGDIQYDCSHVPVDSQGRSLIARDVANATGAGILLTSNLTGLGCDLNSAGDTSIPSETFTPPPSIPGDGLTPIDPGVDTPISGIGGGGSGGGGGGSGGGGGALPPAASPEPEPTPDDGNDPQPLGPMQRCPVPGGDPAIPPVGTCPGAVVKRTIGNIGDEANAFTQTGGAELYRIPLTPPDEVGGDNYNNKFVSFSFECPEGEPGDDAPPPRRQVADPCNNPQPAPEFDPTEYTYYRYTGSTTWHPTTNPGGGRFTLGAAPGAGNFVLWWASGVVSAVDPSLSIGGTLVRIESQSGSVRFAIVKGAIGGPGNLTVTHSGGWEFSNSNTGDDVLATWPGTGV
jgi:hypothetical protein